MVEQKPSKLTTRVRFPSPAPVSADLSPLQQTPERVLRIPLECHQTFGAKPLAARWLVPLGAVVVVPVVGGFLFGDASTGLSASLMRDPVMLLLSGMLMLLVAFCLFMAIWQPLRSGWMLEQTEAGWPVHASYGSV